jgi:hypothetical protein
MESTTPRLRGMSLRLVETLLRTTPLPRLLSHQIVERKLRAIDFAAEGEPAPFYMPISYGTPR